VLTFLKCFTHRKYNKNAKVWRINSVIYWSISMNWQHISRINVCQMYKILLISTLADQNLPHPLFFKHLNTTSGFDGHIGFLRKTVILSIFWHQLHVYCMFSCLRGQMQYDIGICFNFCITSGFGGHFEIFNFNRFFHWKLLTKCVNDAYFCFQEVKIYQIGYFEWKKKLQLPKMTSWRPFCIFDPVLLPEVDNVESWTTIPNLVMRNTTYIPNYKKIGSKLWPWQCSGSYNKYGVCDVINYVTELKLKRT